MKTRRSIALALTLFFSVTSTGVLLGLGVFITTSVEPHFEAGDSEILYGKLELARHALGEIHSANDLSLLQPRLGGALVGHHGLAMTILGSDGSILYATPDITLSPEVWTYPRGSPDDTRPKVFEWTFHGKTYRGLVGLARTAISNENIATVAISVDIGVHRDFMASFSRTLWFSIAFAILGSAILGGLGVRRGLIPIHQMALVTQRISADRLKVRIDMTHLPRELVELAGAFNEMLMRLEEAFQRLSDFSADLAHELRTPINNLMTQTEVALSRPRTPTEYQEVLQSNLEEYSRLARMISDMLFLAKADNGMIVPTREFIDLALEVRQLFEFYDALCEERAITLALNGAATTTGDRLMLRRALSNLLSNAVKHTPRDGRISIRLTSDSSNAVSIQIENSGEDISPEHIPRLFDRFYRADASRSASDESTGLGLAITKSIVEAHGGHISVGSREGNTVFEIMLPRRD